MMYKAIFICTLFFLIGCEPKSVSVLDLKFDRALNIPDEQAMEKLEQLFAENGVEYGKWADGYLEYSTRNFAIVRRLQRIENPWSHESCCVEGFRSSAKAAHFSLLLKRKDIPHHQYQIDGGDINIRWNRRNEILVDNIVQELTIKCIEEIEQKHDYCN